MFLQDGGVSSVYGRVRHWRGRLSTALIGMAFLAKQGGVSSDRVGQHDYGGRENGDESASSHVSDVSILLVFRGTADRIFVHYAG